jgi:hypothetical protein
MKLSDYTDLDLAREMVRRASTTQAQKRAVSVTSTKPSLQKRKKADGKLRDRKDPEALTTLVQEMLNGEWDFSDPANKMRKPAEDVQDFLESVLDNVRPLCYEDMQSGFKGLFDMIWDAYGRWLKEQ